MKRAILSSKTRFKKPIGNIHFGKIILVLLLVFGQFIIFTPRKADAITMQLKDIPLNSIIYDDTWQSNFYDVDGKIRKNDKVEWIVTAKNYYSKQEVTLVTREYLGYTFPTVLGAFNVFPGEMNNVAFISQATDSFKTSLVQVEGICNPNGFSSAEIHTLDLTYVPSLYEMQNWNPRLYVDGIVTRTRDNWSDPQFQLWTSGQNNWTRRAFHPVINLKEDTKVILVGSEVDGRGKYKIFYNQLPNIIISLPSQNSYFGKVNLA